jgi:hypothetical protein
MNVSKSPTPVKVCKFIIPYYMNKIVTYGTMKYTTIAITAVSKTAVDEGMTNGPPIFAYLVFGPRRVSFKKFLKPIKAAV